MVGGVLPFGQEGQFPESAEAESGDLALRLPEPRLPLPAAQTSCSAQHHSPAWPCRWHLWPGTTPSPSQQRAAASLRLFHQWLCMVEGSALISVELEGLGMEEGGQR